MHESTKETLESFVTSALRSRLQESARSVIELRQQLQAALEKVESSIQIAGEKTVSIPDDLLPAPAAPPGAEEAILGHVFKAQQEMLTATEQVGLLTQLLLSCTVSCSRVAFFIVRKDVLMGWAARGFESARDADVRSLSIGFDEDTIVTAAYRSGAPVIAPPGQHAGDEAILSRLGGESPAESIAVPIFLRDKVAAVLYGDCGREPAIVDPELPQILALHAGLCLETLATRQKFPRPRVGLATSRAGSPAPVAAARVSQAERVVGAPATPSPSSIGTEPPSLSGVFRKPEGLTPPGGIPLSREAAEVEVQRPHVAAAPPEADEIVEETSAPQVELSGEDRKLHEEARRFARLLVSEMVLYNEKQVEEGRRHKDIYARLKDDIDRSRQMYEQRISARVRGSSNYFYDEMVRTLANGDRSALNIPWA